MNMKKYGDEKREQSPVTLQVVATVLDNAMFLRQAGATAELRDGAEIEISAAMNNATLIATMKAPDGSWRTYVLTPEAVGAAILHAEGRVLTGQEATTQDNP